MLKQLDTLQGGATAAVELINALLGVGPVEARLGLHPRKQLITLDQTTCRVLVGQFTRQCLLTWDKQHPAGTAWPVTSGLMHRCNHLLHRLGVAHLVALFVFVLDHVGDECSRGAFGTHLDRLAHLQVFAVIDWNRRDGFRRRTLPRELPGGPDLKRIGVRRRWRSLLCVRRLNGLQCLALIHRRVTTLCCGQYHRLGVFNRPACSLHATSDAETFAVPVAACRTLNEECLRPCWQRATLALRKGWNLTTVVLNLCDWKMPHDVFDVMHSLAVEHELTERARRAGLVLGVVTAARHPHDAWQVVNLVVALQQLDDATLHGSPLLRINRVFKTPVGVGAVATVEQDGRVRQAARPDRLHRGVGRRVVEVSHNASARLDRLGSTIAVAARVHAEVHVLPLVAVQNLFEVMNKSTWVEKPLVALGFHGWQKPRLNKVVRLKEHVEKVIEVISQRVS